jgi:hypothetical protein
MFFLVFNKGKPSKDGLPSGKIIFFSKLGTLLHFRAKNLPLKSTTFWEAAA